MAEPSQIQNIAANQAARQAVNTAFNIIRSLLPSSAEKSALGKVASALTVSTTGATSPIAAATDVQEVTGSTATTQTLPASVSNRLGFITIKNRSTALVTLAAAAGTTIEAATTVAANASLSMYLSGTVWRVLR